MAGMGVVFTRLRWAFGTNRAIGPLMNDKAKDRKNDVKKISQLILLLLIWER
jgi:hypothetical protein